MLEMEFLNAITQPTGDKWQSKTLFLAIFDPHSSIVRSLVNCCQSGVETKLFFQQKYEKCK